MNKLEHCWPLDVNSMVGLMSRGGMGGPMFDGGGGH